MGSVGIAVLAGPLAHRYTDRAFICAQQSRIEHLEELYAQQAELLSNAQTPSVVERQAINRLNYVPAQPAVSETTPLPESWPDLQAALAGIDQPPPPAHLPAHHRLTIALADRQAIQGVLLILGCSLVLIAMTCFNRPR